jgi:hypothetical protein
MSTSAEDKPQPPVNPLTVKAIAEAIGERLGQPSDSPRELRAHGYTALTRTGQVIGLQLDHHPLGSSWRGQTTTAQVKATSNTILYDLFPPLPITPAWRIESFDPINLADGAYLDLTETTFRDETLVAVDAHDFFGNIYSSYRRGLAAARNLGLLGVSQTTGDDLLRMVRQAAPTTNDPHN